jgi:hypothetical protein
MPPRTSDWPTPSTGRLYAAVCAAAAHRRGAARRGHGGGSAWPGPATVVAAPDARLQFSEVRLGFVPALIRCSCPPRPAAALCLFLDPSR